MTATVRSTFNNPRVRRWLVRLRVPLAIVAIIVAVPFLQREWLLAGFIVSMIGEGSSCGASHRSTRIRTLRSAVRMRWCATRCTWAGTSSCSAS